MSTAPEKPCNGSAMIDASWVSKTRTRAEIETSVEDRETNIYPREGWIIQQGWMPPLF